MTEPFTHHSFYHLRSPAQVTSLNFDNLDIYTRYRGHPELDRLDHIRLLQHELGAALAAGGRCSAIIHGEIIQAICAVTPLAWDSEHFGQKMAKISISSCPAVAPKTLQLLAEKTVMAANLGREVHISCEVDIDNYLCLNTLLSMGAEILDLKREYRAKSLKNVPPPKFRAYVRPYTEADRDSILEILDYSFFATRFSRDSILCHQKSQQLYRQWMKKILDRSDEERTALVVEKAGVVLACGTIEAQDLRFAGVDLQLMSGGIYVSRSDATGYYYPVIYELIQTALTHYSTAQTCISLNNHAAVRVLEKMNFGTNSTRYALRLAR